MRVEKELLRSMNNFKTLLEQFDAALRKYNPVNYTKLQPPLPKKEINRYLTNFELKIIKNYCCYLAGRMALISQMEKILAMKYGIMVLCFR